MEKQAEYVINPNYQQWVLDCDIEEDELPEQEHRHAWNLDYNIHITTDKLVEVEIIAWCECGKELTQYEAEGVLNGGKP